MSDLPHIPNWVTSAQTTQTSPRITITNPATEPPIATIDATPLNTINAIIHSALETFKNGPWSHADPSKRCAVLSKAASLLRARIPEFVDLEVQQTGRPIREMRAQLARIPEWLEYFASLARVHQGRVAPFKGPVVNTLTRLPLGVVAQITPWNQLQLNAQSQFLSTQPALHNFFIN